MVSDSQSQKQIIDFLSERSAYGPGTGVVERIETHVSILFLTGDRAYKMKRAVALPYLDFSTRVLRRAACLAEIAINRRTAPGIYRGAVPVTRQADGGYRLGGAGEAVEWLVEMNRFDQEALLGRVAEAGRLKRRTLEDLAESIARFHDQAEVSRRRGGARAMAEILANNGASFARFGGHIFAGDKVDGLAGASREALDKLAPLLDVRRAQSKVRRCHGDLHLDNIVMIDGRPVLFDAIEFNDVFSIIDVFYDLAFLLMDLDQRGLEKCAAQVLNRYLEVTGDVAGLACLPLFLALRAGVRAQVGATAAARLSDAGQALERAEAARGYLDAALAYLVPRPPRLIAIGGLSGSGKSHLARKLAPRLGAAPGAFVARSDAIRKRLAGAAPGDRLGAVDYGPEKSRRTYDQLMEDARVGIEAGHTVIADAVFARPEERAAIARVAARVHVPFHGLWLEAPAEIMEHRVSSRTHNISDATVQVVRAQLNYDLGDIEWRRMDSSGSRNKTRKTALRALGLED